MIDLIQKPSIIRVIEDVPEIRENDKKYSKIILDEKIRNQYFETTWIHQAIRNRLNMILFGELLLKSQEINDLKYAIDGNDLVISTLHAASVKHAIDRLEYVGFAKHWKWMIVTKKSDNGIGFEIDGFYKINSKTKSKFLMFENFLKKLLKY